MHRHVDEPGELPREVLDVDARAAVDVRRVLAGEERDAHASGPLYTLALADDDDPAGRDDEALRSCSGSTPSCAPGSITTFLSTIAFRTIAPSPTSTPSHQHGALDLGAASGRSTPGESTDRRTIPPETITPAQTIESTAMPVCPGSSKTNFAGG